MAAAFFGATMVRSQDNNASSQPEATAPLTLAQASVCEDVRNYAPYYSAIAFSIEVGKLSCFSLFDPVPEETFIYHQWFFRDKPSTKKRLRVKPPRWATFSTIELRQTDKGPWRVEISDQNGTIMKTLRFSVTD